MSTATVETGNLIFVRRLFYEATGRADLVDTSDYSDSGADRFINAGQRYLDRKADIPGNIGAHPLPFATGQFLTYAPDARAISEVWYENADGRTQLDEKRHDWMRSEYHFLTGVTAAPNRLINTSMTQGTPKYYSVISLSAAPGQASWLSDLANSMRYGADGILHGDVYNQVGVLVAPPPDEDGDLILVGKWYSPALHNDYDTSWWTMMAPETLAWAAAYILEVFYRNTQGANDWLRAINDSVRYIDFDAADQESANQNQMQG